MNQSIKELYDSFNVEIGLEALNHGPDCFNLFQEGNGTWSIRYVNVANKFAPWRVDSPSKKFAVFSALALQSKNDQGVLERYEELLETNQPRRA